MLSDEQTRPSSLVGLGLEIVDMTKARAESVQMASLLPQIYPDLMALDLPNWNMQGEEIASLCHSFRQLRHLEVLNLRGNNFESPVAWRSMAQLILDIPTL